MELLTPPDSLVRGMLYEESLAMLYGGPRVGKSFLAISLGCAIATGTDWFGRDVRKGSGVYVCAEGATSQFRRIAAWEARHGMRVSGFYMISQPR